MTTPRPDPADTAVATGGLLARLMATVRPEFRVDVFRPARDDAAFVRGVCRVAGCPTALCQSSRELCNRHYQRWLADRSQASDFEAWLVQEDQRQARRGIPPECEVTGCNRATAHHGLCNRHERRWSAAGRPERGGWVAATGYTPPPAGEHDCAFPGCPRWSDGPGTPYCHQHRARWIIAGRPDPAGWHAAVAEKAIARQTPHVKLGRLGRALRLEVQYGLQCRHDEANKRTPAGAVTIAIKRLAESGVASILDLDEHGWRTFCGTNRPIYAGRRMFASVSLKFILDTRIRLQRLLIAPDPWADQYPREVWDLRLLGITEAGIRFLRFGGVPQPWLRDLARRWCRWRLARGLSPSTVYSNLAGIISFAAYLAGRSPADTGPGGLTREAIESWLATGRLTSQIGGLGVFLRDVHRHHWAPEIPANARVFEDFPTKPASKPRWISEHLMRQVESEPNLARFGNDDARLVLRILISCGLRLKDARMLPFDCIVRDNTGAPYLAWINHKIAGRVAFFPLAETLAAQIAEQQQRVLARFPGGCRWLFPALKVNIDGSRPMPGATFRDYLDRWLRHIHLVDEHGNPTRVTAHQFRHTLGTRLINADVPQHVVQQLLDHMSPQMTAVYARLHNQTLRQHWERAVKLDSDGNPATIPAGHPLAGAAWMRLSLVRAKVTLPNGYCGAPVQTDCEYANPCLDCRFFITTADFLDQHRRQRDETHTLIDDAEASGLSRIAERNRRTLGKLDTIIGALEATGPGQVVAGGVVENLDAA